MPPLPWAHGSLLDPIVIIGNDRAGKEGRSAGTGLVAPGISKILAVGQTGISARHFGKSSPFGLLPEHALLQIRIGRLRPEPHLEEDRTKAGPAMVSFSWPLMAKVVPVPGT